MVKEQLISLGAYCFATNDLAVFRASGVCEACGGYGPFQYDEIIKDKLAKEWDLNKSEQKAFSARESMFCVFCGCSYRLRMLARSMVLRFSPEKNISLLEAIEKGFFDKIKVAEINSCGVLHDILKKIPKLYYSEFLPEDRKTRHEDMQRLTYNSNYFDLVIHSDTVEHIPDYKTAIKESQRVLKKDKGVTIFTLPARLDKKTVNRATIDSAGRTKRTRAASFHGAGQEDYFVWNEFGHDFTEYLGSIFPSVELYFLNINKIIDPSFVFVASNSKKLVKKAIVVDKLSISKSKKPQTSQFVSFNSEQQLKVLIKQYEKNILTQNHIKNIEAINASQSDYIEKMSNHLSDLNQEIMFYNRHLYNKVVLKLNKRRAK